MATIERLHQALINADAAGDVDAAKVFAAEIRRMQAEQTKTKHYDPTEGMSKTEKFLAGVGKSFSDIGLGVRQYLPESIGGVTGEEIERRRKLDEPLMRTGLGQAGNITGALLTAAPTVLLPGANTLTGGAAIGAAMGALQPSATGQERMANVGIGAGAGAVIPAAITAGKTVKSFVEPFYQTGREQIIGRAINQTAGAEAGKALRNLQGAKELVPGSFPTVAEAAQVPSIAAMQRAAIATTPSATNQLAARELAQNEARINALRSIAPDKAAAMQARETATEQLYKTSMPKTVQMTDELSTLMKRPSMKTALQRAKALAAEAGEDLKVINEIPEATGLIQDATGKALTVTPKEAGSMSGKAAHYIKMGLDDLTKAPATTGIVGNELKAIQQTRADFLNALEGQLPEYGQARTTYAKLSRPVNQADVLQEIERKAVNFRGDITPAAYARAMQDATARNVLNQPKATMQAVMEPSQMQTMQAIKDDLLRSDFAKTAGRGVGSDTVQKLAYSNMLNQAGLPNMLRSFAPVGIVGNIAQRAGQVAYRDANEQMTQELAEAMLNPARAAELMQAGIVSPRLIELANALRRGGTALGAAAPAMVNSNQ